MNLLEFISFKQLLAILILFVIVCICDRLFLPQPSWLLPVATGILGLYCLLVFIKQRRTDRTDSSTEGRNADSPGG